MPLSICYLKKMSLEDWVEIFPISRLIPRKVVGEIVNLFPAVRIKETNFEIASRAIRMCEIGVAREKPIPKNLMRLLNKIDPDYIIARDDVMVLTDELRRRGFRVEIFDGNRAKGVLLLDAIEQYIGLRNRTIKKPRIFIWGADSSQGQVMTSLLAKHSFTITAYGENSSVISRLSNNILYETGTSIILSTNPTIDLPNSDLIILASPVPFHDVLDDEAKEKAAIRNPKRITIYGPRICSNSCGKKNVVYGWTFFLIEALFFLLIKSEGNLEKEGSLADISKRMSEVLRRWGFRVTIEGESPILSIFP